MVPDVGDGELYLPSWWKPQVKGIWGIPSHQQNRATGGGERRVVGVGSGKGLRSRGTGEATDLGDGRWRGCKRWEDESGGFTTHRQAKIQLGVCEGDANSHFQE